MFPFVAFATLFHQLCAEGRWKEIVMAKHAVPSLAMTISFLAPHRYYIQHHYYIQHELELFLLPLDLEFFLHLESSSSTLFPFSFVFRQFSSSTQKSSSFPDIRVHSSSKYIQGFERIWARLKAGRAREGGYKRNRQSYYVVIEER